MMSRSVLGVVAVAILMSPIFAADELKGIVGHYERENPENEWHIVAINTAPDGGPYWWVNRLGKRWIVDGAQSNAGGGAKTKYFLKFGDKAMYPGHTFHPIRKDGKIVGLKEFDKDGKELPSWVRKEFRIQSEFKGVTGNYKLEKPTNGWHVVTINTAPDVGLAWVNREGKRWSIAKGSENPGGGRKINYFLSFHDDSPYPGHTLKMVRDDAGELTHLKEYDKDGNYSQTWVRQK